MCCQNTVLHENASSHSRAPTAPSVIYIQTIEESNAGLNNSGALGIASLVSNEDAAQNEIVR
jgi:hypothetical protein